MGACPGMDGLESHSLGGRWRGGELKFIRSGVKRYDYYSGQSPLNVSGMAGGGILGNRWTDCGSCGLLADPQRASKWRVRCHCPLLAYENAS